MTEENYSPEAPNGKCGANGDKHDLDTQPLAPEKSEPECRRVLAQFFGWTCHRTLRETIVSTPERKKCPKACPQPETPRELEMLVVAVLNGDGQLLADPIDGFGGHMIWSVGHAGELHGHIDSVFRVIQISGD